MGAIPLLFSRLDTSKAFLFIRAIGATTGSAYLGCHDMIPFKTDRTTLFSFSSLTTSLIPLPCPNTLID